MADLQIAEICARSGANCGSIFLDLRFRELVQNLLENHPTHLDPLSLAYFMHSFSETDKLAYKGVGDDSMELSPPHHAAVVFITHSCPQIRRSTSRASTSTIHTTHLWG